MLTPALLRAIARGTRVLTNENHLPSPGDAKAVAALPADCRELAHLLAPRHRSGQLHLYRA